MFTRPVKPDQARAAEYRNRALTELEGGGNLLAKAIADFKQVIAYAPNDPLGYMDEVLAAQRGTQLNSLPVPTKELEADVQKGLDLAPESSEVHLLAAYLYGNWAKSTPSELPSAERATDEAIRLDPNNIRARWEWFRLRSFGGDNFGSPIPSGALDQFQAIDRAAPGNLVIVMRLVEAYLQAHQPQKALPYVQEWKQEDWLPSESVPKAQMDAMLDSLASQIKSGGASITPLAVLSPSNLTKPGPLYRSALNELVLPMGSVFNGMDGAPLTRFKDEKSPDTPLGDAVPVKFVDETATAGLAGANQGGVIAASVGSLSLQPGLGKAGSTYAVQKFPPLDIVVLDRRGQPHIWLNNGHGFHPDTTSLPAGPPGKGLALADYELPGENPQFSTDEQHPADLLIFGPGGSRFLYRTLDGKYQDRTANAHLGSLKATFGVPVDFNQDGNLDLLAGGAGPGISAYAGLGKAGLAPGTEVASARGRAFSGLTPAPSNSSMESFHGLTNGITFADFAGDGSLNFYVANCNGPGVYYRNLRQGRLIDQTTAAGLAKTPPSCAAASADWNHDGFPDLAIGAVDGSGVRLYQNRGDGAFSEVTPTAISSRTRGYRVTSLAFLDYDNDGLEDLAVGLAAMPGHPAPASGVALFHNDGQEKWSDAGSILPPHLPSATQLIAADMGDGAPSLVVVGSDQRLHYLHNLGGARNHWINVALWGHQYAKGSVSAEGIGSALQVLIGSTLLQKTVTGQLTHFGLGKISNPDAIRALLSDGIPEDFPNEALPSLASVHDTTLEELVVLSGSCPFVYGWDGTNFRFVTDALCAAPLGLLLNATTYAPANPVDDLVLPHWLRPRDGLLTVAMTEELAELTFLDSARLISIDHPSGTTLVANEAFGGMKSTRPWYLIGQTHMPLHAWDTSGRDVLSTIRSADYRYVHDFQPGPYPGITRDHWLTLDLGALPQNSPVTLFLNGWIRWTNTTINVAMSRDSQVKPEAPRVEVPDGHGHWRTVIPFIGLVAGKSKTMAVDLTGKFLSPDHRVRIRTNYCIYWDQAYFTLGRTGSVAQKISSEIPCRASLEYHGYSRMSPVAPYGPSIPNYRDHLAYRAWPALPGWCTAYGNVTALLQKSDDRWVTINSGDQCTIQFQIPRTPPAAGMTRDYILELDGWDKDNNYYTADSGSVEPYPFHGMKGYPYPSNQRYPQDAAHQKFLHDTLTRWVDRTTFLADLPQHVRDARGSR